MKESLKRLNEKVYEKLHNFIKNGGWITILMIAFFGIASAVVSHYSLMGFNWKWFVFFEMPLYWFCGWAFYNVFKTIKKFQNNEQD
jgi:membrane protein DedA with SNARE-associated domain